MITSEGLLYNIDKMQSHREYPILAPESLNLDQMVRDSLYTCRSPEGREYSRHKTFQPTVYIETDDSNGPIIGDMCPRCGYWAGTLKLAKEGIIVPRWPQ